MQVSSLKKGSLVKPSFLQVKSDAQSTWVIGESLRGIMCGDSELSESAVVHVWFSVPLPSTSTWSMLPWWLHRLPFRREPILM